MSPWTFENQSLERLALCKLWIHLYYVALDFTWMYILLPFYWPINLGMYGDLLRNRFIYLRVSIVWYRLFRHRSRCARRYCIKHRIYMLGYLTHVDLQIIACLGIHTLLAPNSLEKIEIRWEAFWRIKFSRRNQPLVKSTSSCKMVETFPLKGAIAWKQVRLVGCLVRLSTIHTYSSLSPVRCSISFEKNKEKPLDLG